MGHGFHSYVSLPEGTRLSNFSGVGVCWSCRFFTMFHPFFLKLRWGRCFPSINKHCLAVTGTREFYDFPFSWEWNNDPNWRTPSFFRGVATTNQVIFVWTTAYWAYWVLDPWPNPSKHVKTIQCGTQPVMSWFITPSTIDISTRSPFYGAPLCRGQISQSGEWSWTPGHFQHLNLPPVCYLSG